MTDTPQAFTHPAYEAVVLYINGLIPGAPIDAKLLAAMKHVKGIGNPNIFRKLFEVKNEND